MIVVNRTVNAWDELGAHTFAVRHRTVVAIALAAAAAAIALMMAGNEFREAVPPIVTAAPATPEKFDYFPDRYQNTAKQVEEPIATF